MARPKNVSEKTISNGTIDSDLKPAKPPQPPLPRLVDQGRPCKEFQYAVKLVSGTANQEQGAGIVAPGRYYTAVNIHNPATCKTVTFRWKLAVADPLRPGTITRFQSLTLRPDQAVEIDSPQAAKVLGIDSNRFVKGFVVIESPCELDVVAVYTVGAPAHGNTGNAVAFHTERVPARVIESCRDDLKLDLSTGATEWTLVSAVNLFNPNVPLPGIATPRPANVIDPADVINWHSQPGAQWISVRGSNHNLSHPYGPGYFIFQRCFTLCSGFENPLIDLHVLVDDFATLWLNDHQVATVSGSANPTHVPINNPSWFLPGLNCLSFVVTNVVYSDPPNNPVGLNVHGTLTAARGECPDCGCCSDCGAEKVYPPRRIVPNTEAAGDQVDRPD